MQSMPYPMDPEWSPFNPVSSDDFRPHQQPCLSPSGLCMFNLVWSCLTIYAESLCLAYGPQVKM